MDYLRYSSTFSVSQHHNIIDRRLNHSQLIQTAVYNPGYGSGSNIAKSKAINIPASYVKTIPKLEIREKTAFPPLDPVRIKKADLIAYAPKFIERYFGCDSTPPETFQTKIQLASFLLNIMNRTRINTCTLTAAFFYLNRLKQLHPKCKGSPGSGYKLFLAAIILAAKYMYDDTFDNTAWATVSSGLFPLMDVNHMEREMLSFLDFQLFITDSEWLAFNEILFLDMSADYKDINKRLQQSYKTPTPSTDDLHLVPPSPASYTWNSDYNNRQIDTLKYVENSWSRGQGLARP